MGWNLTVGNLPNNFEADCALSPTPSVFLRVLRWRPPRLNGQLGGLGLVDSTRTLWPRHLILILALARASYCRNPDLAAQRTRKRQELLAATERDLARIQAAVARKRNPLRGAAQIALAVGAVIEQHKMRKHFDLAIATKTLLSRARLPRSPPKPLPMAYI